MRRTGGMILIALTVLACLLALRDAPRGSKAFFQAVGRDAALVTPAPPRGTISVNRADAEELTQLKGVGDALAQAIVDEREQHGSFHYPEDLTAVKGIGPSKLEGFREMLDMSEGE